MGIASPQRPSVMERMAMEWEVINVFFFFPICAPSSLPDSETGEDPRYSLDLGCKWVLIKGWREMLGGGILSMDSGVCSLYNFRGMRPNNKACTLNEGKIWFLGKEKT